MKRKFVTGFCLFAAVVLFGMAACSQKLAVRFYTEVSEKVEEPVRLALIADLHSTFYGEGQEELVRILQEQKPDAVLLAGDIADDKVPHDGTKVLLEAIGTSYPCFYVTGNHEYWSGRVRTKASVRSGSYGRMGESAHAVPAFSGRGAVFRTYHAPSGTDSVLYAYAGRGASGF